MLDVIPVKNKIMKTIYDKLCAFIDNYLNGPDAERITWDTIYLLNCKLEKNLPLPYKYWELKMLRDENHNSLLHWASGLNNRLLVMLCIDQEGLGIDGSLRNDEGKTFLHVLVEANHLNLAQEVIGEEEDVDLDIQDNEGNTVLHLAATKIDSLAGELLLESESVVIDPSIVNNNGDTFLHIAIEMGNFELAQAALKVEMNFNVQNKQGDTVLHKAAKIPGSKLAVDLLEKTDVDPSIKNPDGDTFLHVALKLGNYAAYEGMLEYLQTRMDLNSQNDEGNTLLHIAATKGYFWMVGLLVEKGRVQTWIKNSNNKTAYFVAQTEEVRRLMRELEDNSEEQNEQIPIEVLSHYLTNDIRQKTKEKRENLASKVSSNNNNTTKKLY